MKRLSENIAVAALRIMVVCLGVVAIGMSSVAMAASGAGQAAQADKTAALREQLNRIKIPVIDFYDAEVTEVVAFFNRAAQQHGFASKPIKIVLDLRIPGKAGKVDVPRVTLHCS